MKRLVLLLVTLVSSLWLPMISAVELPPHLSGTGQAKIRFDCTSTLHDFTGYVDCEPFTWEILPDPNTGKPIVWGKVEVVVDKMDTYNKGRDEKMHAMFESKKYPRIYGSVVDVNLVDCMPILRKVESQNELEEIPGILPVVLKIRTQEHKGKAKITNFHGDSKKITFTLDATLSLNQFGLEPPSVLGLIRVGDKVKVHIYVTLTPTPLKDQASDNSTNTNPTNL